MKRVLLIFLLFWGIPRCAMLAHADTCPDPQMISSLSFESLDTLSLSGCSAQELILLLGVATQLELDTLMDPQIKADICFNMIANELQERKSQKNFDPNDPSILFVVSQLELHQYHLALTKPSDWQKLSHYIQEGRWSYVAKRFVDREYHYYLIGICLLGLVGFVLYRRFRTQKPRI